MPAISVIICSHNKPQYVMQAIQSVIDQTMTDWNAILVDSGVLLDSGFFSQIKDSRIEIVRSNEPKDLPNAASWVFNRVLDSGKISGELVMYLCDDDVFYPNAFESIWDFYNKNGKPDAFYGHEHYGLGRNGQTIIQSQRIADIPRGMKAGGARLDGVVDYLQLCHTAKLIDAIKKAFPNESVHSERAEDRRHADGIFFEKLATLTPVIPMNTWIGINRRTEVSIAEVNG